MSKKTVDITERTLEKEKKNFIEFCKVVEVFFSVILVFMVIAAIAIFIMTIMSNIILTDEPTAEEIFYSVYLIAICIGTSIALNFGVKVFKELKKGETPFRYEIADKIKAAGMTLIGTGVVHIIAEIVRGFLYEAGNFTVKVSLTFDFDFCICGVAVLAIAYIFNYGCKLQQESDETI